LADYCPEDIFPEDICPEDIFTVNICPGDIFPHLFCGIISSRQMSSSKSLPGKCSLFLLQINWNWNESEKLDGLKLELLFE
jgi:hypothetical protein